MRSQPTLQTERLLLRPFTLADVSEVQRFANAREISDRTLLIPHPYTEEMAEKWIASHPGAFAAGEHATFALVSRDHGKLVGAMSLSINLTHRYAELGFWVGAPLWGRGFCTEAARAVIRYGFEGLKLHRIHSAHFGSNPASGRVLQKIGMTYEGCQRQHIRKNGRFEDRLNYGILAMEWARG